MHMCKVNELIVRAALVAFFLCITSQIFGQGKEAVVIFRPTNSDTAAAGCEGAAEINYQIIYDAKLNAKDELRLGFDRGGQFITHDVYDKLGKSKLRDLFALKWGRDDQLYAVSVAGQPAILAVPDNLKPQKNSGGQPLSAFYGVSLSGEAHDGKQKRKVDLALRSVWKIYFISEGGSTNDMLFAHAAEESTVALWEAYLQKTNNYRAAEANAKMRDALIGCSRVDLGHFVDGDYRSLDKARQKAARAQSVKDDDATRQLLGDIGSAQKNVEDARAKGEQLIKSEKWDDAIDALEPIRKYLETWPDLNKMHRQALEASHEKHLNAGRTALEANQLESALKDCSTARTRLPDSEPALTCVCKARTEIAVRDSKKNRQVSRPKDAKELLEKEVADGECKTDPRITEELKLSKCEYSKQLYVESRQLLGLSGGTSLPAPPASGRRRGGASTAPANTTNASSNVKAITMQNKQDFRNAREKLMLASEMCPGEESQGLLAAVNRSLSKFCVDEARKAIQRNDNGTAYVYLQKAQGYTPEDAQIPQLLAQAREKFQEQTRVNIGVVFANRSGNGGAGEYLGQVGAAVESAGTSAGLANPTILEGDGAEQSLRAIQAGRALNSPTVIFFGELLTAGARLEHNTQSVSSTYSQENPEYRRASDVIDAKSREIDGCKKQNPGNDAACNYLRQQRDQMRDARGRIQRYLQIPYSFTQTDFHVQGSVRMSFRSTDSISRATGDALTLSDDVKDQCQQREGVRNDDSRGAGNHACQIADEGTYVGQMFTKIRNEAQLHALEALRALPSSYYRRAQSAANKSQAVESYLRFLFLTSSKSGSEAEQAKAFLTAYDPELNTDGIMR